MGQGHLIIPCATISKSVFFKVKLEVWEEAQRLKLDQNRWIANLLVLTKTTYIAVASEDKVHISFYDSFVNYYYTFKFFGTGWRKNRDERFLPYFKINN